MFVVVVVFVVVVRGRMTMSGVVVERESRDCVSKGKDTREEFVVECKGGGSVVFLKAQV